jgi:hypothetical protein
VTVDSTIAGTTTINGNSDNDVFTVNNVVGPITIDAGAGTNQLFTDLPLSITGLTFLDPNGATATPLSGGGATGGGLFGSGGLFSGGGLFGSGGLFSGGGLFGSGGLFGGGI